MTPPRPQRRGWRVAAGAVVWLILASSISLELGEQDAAKWSSAATLTVIALGVLTAALWMLAFPIRAAVRRSRRRRQPESRTRHRR